METKLTIAGCLAFLAYVISGFYLLTIPIGFLGGGRSNLDWNAVGQMFLLFCVGLVFDILAEIGWRVHRLTEPKKADSDSPL